MVFDRKIPQVLASYFKNHYESFRAISNLTTNCNSNFLGIWKTKNIRFQKYIMLLSGNHHSSNDYFTNYKEKCFETGCFFLLSHDHKSFEKIGSYNRCPTLCEKKVEDGFDFPSDKSSASFWIVRVGWGNLMLQSICDGCWAQAWLKSTRPSWIK